jgi:hypothetical protein
MQKGEQIGDYHPTSILYTYRKRGAKEGIKGDSVNAIIIGTTPTTHLHILY